MLPKPSLEACELGSLPVLTDNALARSTGVRVLFTGRAGGVSAEPYASLNLGGHVGDDPRAVAENRTRLLEALGLPDARVISPLQVHGTTLVDIRFADAASFEQATTLAQEGADGVVVGVSDTAALLCFADCVPVVVVSPTGLFAVVHAGWRGVAASIVPRAIARMLEIERERDASSTLCAADFNVYVGPFIHAECFETGPDVHAAFLEAFGDRCVYDARHIDLLQALLVDLERNGVDPARVVESGVCTVCHAQEYFSYRASQGVCGRHGAFAIRVEGERWQ